MNNLYLLNAFILQFKQKKPALKIAVIQSTLKPAQQFSFSSFFVVYLFCCCRLFDCIVYERYLRRWLHLAQALWPVWLVQRLVTPIAGALVVNTEAAELSMHSAVLRFPSAKINKNSERWVNEGFAVVVNLFLIHLFSHEVYAIKEKVTSKRKTLNSFIFLDS